MLLLAFIIQLQLQSDWITSDYLTGFIAQMVPEHPPQEGMELDYPLQKKLQIKWEGPLKQNQRRMELPLLPQFRRL